MAATVYFKNGGRADLPNAVRVADSAMPGSNWAALAFYATNDQEVGHFLVSEVVGYTVDDQVPPAGQMTSTAPPRS